MVIRWRGRSLEIVPVHEGQGGGDRGRMILRYNLGVLGAGYAAIASRGVVGPAGIVDLDGHGLDATGSLRVDRLERGDVVSIEGPESLEPRQRLIGVDHLSPVFLSYASSVG